MEEMVFLTQLSSFYCFIKIILHIYQKKNKYVIDYCKDFLEKVVVLKWRNYPTSTVCKVSMIDLVLFFTWTYITFLYLKIIANDARYFAPTQTSNFLSFFQLPFLMVQWFFGKLDTCWLSKFYWCLWRSVAPPRSWFQKWKKYLAIASKLKLSCHNLLQFDDIFLLDSR